ncbi:hypothetical protein LENED_009510 [Lentinula edodes]|uniref:Protein kinase domain-containing protein n=1 Tax=Lentinula edodes TaxID=5353 RepID=A0A1Q3EJY5_LENED|nr:hypothetical protein LENED_009510 [Lentinula edodes]
MMAKTIQSAPTPAEPVNCLDPIRVKFGQGPRGLGAQCKLVFPADLGNAYHSFQPSWILDFSGNNAYLNDEDKKAFNKPLGKAVIGPRIDCEGYHNEGIYLLQEDYMSSKILGSKIHRKTAVIVKVMDEVDKNALGEVRALKDVDLYIDSGMAIIHKQKKPVILMGKGDGVSILDTVQFKDAVKGGNEKEIDGWLEQMRPLVKEQVVFWALSGKRLLHVDFNLGNIHIGAKTAPSSTSQEVRFDYPIKKARVLDFGYPGIFKVSDRVTKEEVEKWFELQWESRTSKSVS